MHTSKSARQSFTRISHCTSAQLVLPVDCSSWPPGNDSSRCMHPQTTLVLWCLKGSLAVAAFRPRCKAAAVHASTHVTCRHQLPCNCVLPPELHLAYPFDNLLHQGVLADAVCTSAAGASPLGHRSRPQQAGSHQKRQTCCCWPFTGPIEDGQHKPRRGAPLFGAGQLQWGGATGLPRVSRPASVCAGRCSDPGGADAQSSKVCRVADHTGMGCQASCHWLLFPTPA